MASAKLLIANRSYQTLARYYSTNEDKSKPENKSTKLVPSNSSLYAARALARLEQRQRKEELLLKERSWIGRMRVRFKWLMIRGQRPFNTDDLSAMFSWIIWGHILWIVLGTTTFLSLLIWLFSKSSRASDFLATTVANIVTKETGLHVVFEEAIVPDWKQGSITLRKVFVSRRPGVHEKPKIGSQATAKQEARTHQAASVSDDGNYTQFDITIDSVAVTLSFNRWMAGKGILKTVELHGVRGVVDRRFLRDDPTYDATKHRSKPKRGDFEFTAFKMDDVLLDVQFTTHMAPLSVYSCDLPQLRKQWLFYDFLNASSITGSYDNSLFTLHPRQQSAVIENSVYRSIQRLRIDDLDIRHLNRGEKGMFGWIESGTVDFLADIMLPSDLPDISFRENVQDVLEHWELSILGKPDQQTRVEKAIHERQEAKKVLIDLRVQFNNPKAAAPLFTRDLTYLNNALIHPIVAYINSRDTYIPVHCRIIKNLSDFNGSWTVYDSGLMPDVSNELYQAVSQNAADEEARSRRIRKVGFWSLQFLAQLVLLMLGIVA